MTAPEGEADGGRLRKRSVMVAGHRTSISLEEAFWQALTEIAGARGLSLNALVSEIDARRALLSDAPDRGGGGGNLSGAIRVYVLEWYRGRV